MKFAKKEALQEQALMMQHYTKCAMLFLGGRAYHGSGTQQVNREQRACQLPDQTAGRQRNEAEEVTV